MVSFLLGLEHLLSDVPRAVPCRLHAMGNVLEGVNAATHLGLVVQDVLAVLVDGVVPFLRDGVEASALLTLLGQLEELLLPPFRLSFRELFHGVEMHADSRSLCVLSLSLAHHLAEALERVCLLSINVFLGDSGRYVVSLEHELVAVVVDHAHVSEALDAEYGVDKAGLLEPGSHIVRLVIFQIETAAFEILRNAAFESCLHGRGTILLSLMLVLVDGVVPFLAGLLGSDWFPRATFTALLAVVLAVPDLLLLDHLRNEAPPVFGFLLLVQLPRDDEAAQDVLHVHLLGLGEQTLTCSGLLLVVSDSSLAPPGRPLPRFRLCELPVCASPGSPVLPARARLKVRARRRRRNELLRQVRTLRRQLSRVQFPPRELCTERKALLLDVVRPDLVERSCTLPGGGGLLSGW